MHFDTFELPKGATTMAASEITHCQAFRFGENVFAFQFHFEITPENAALFIKETKGATNTINTSEFKTGVYFLKITTNLGTGTTKIIKE